MALKIYPSRHHWTSSENYSLKRKKSKKNIHRKNNIQNDFSIHKNNNKPALDFFEYYFGEIEYQKQRINDINSLYSQFPIAVYETPPDNYNSGVFDYLRTPISFDLEDRSVSFAGTIPEGSFIKLTTVNLADIAEGAKYSMKKVFKASKLKHIVISLVFSCCSRHRILGSLAKNEFEYLKSKKLKNYVGFYGYGEISPTSEGEKSKYLSSTILTVLMGV